MKVRLDRVLEGVLSATAGRMAGQQQATQELERRDQEDFARALQMFSMMQQNEQAGRGQELDALAAMGRIPNLTPDSLSGLAQRAAGVAGRPSQYNPASLMGMRGAPRGFGMIAPPQQPGTATPQPPPLSLQVNPDVDELTWALTQYRSGLASGRLSPDQQAKAEQAVAVLAPALQKGMTKADVLKAAPFLGPALTGGLPTTSIDPKVYNSALAAMQKAETDLSKALTSNPGIDPEERAILEQLLSAGVTAGTPSEESHRELVHRTRQLLAAAARLTSGRSQALGLRRHEIAEQNFKNMLQSYGEGRVGTPDAEQARKSLLQAEDDLNVERAKLGLPPSDMLGGLRGSFDEPPSREDVQADAARRIAKQFPEAQKGRSARVARIMSAAKSVPVQDRAAWIRHQLGQEGIESGLTGDPFMRQEQLDRFRRLTDPKNLKTLATLSPETQQISLEEIADLADLLDLDVALPKEIEAQLAPGVKTRLELEERRVKVAEQRRLDQRSNEAWKRLKGAFSKAGTDPELKILKDRAARAWGEYKLFIQTNGDRLGGHMPGAPLRTDKTWRKIDQERAPLYNRQNLLFQKAEQARKDLEEAENKQLGGGASGPAPAASAPAASAPAPASPGAAPQPPPPKVSWKDQPLSLRGQQFSWWDAEKRMRASGATPQQIAGKAQEWRRALRAAGYKGPL